MTGGTTERGTGRPLSTPRVALLEKRGRFLTAVPFFDKGRRMTVAPDRDAPLGSLVLVRPGTRGAPQATIVRVIGRPDTAADVLEALMLERGLRRRFDPAVERAAREAASGPPVRDVVRRDLRDLPTFTIDPPTAKDFDDAISAEVVDGGEVVRVWVHIADVSAFVRPGSLVDREAYRRGTSVYVPGKVEPMLPEALSNVACSLVPGTDRLAVTVELDLAGANVRRAAFYRSLIRSDARLDYPLVDRVFAGTEPAQAPWGEPLAAARHVAEALQAVREARGALAVESLAPTFAFDRHGHVERVAVEEQTESHRVIEHLMIAANEAVAELLESRKLPTLYRVHEPPDPPRVQRLVEQLAALEVPTPAMPEHFTPQQATDLVGAISQGVAEHVQRRGRGRIALNSLVLRALKQAHYSPRNVGHAGLRSPRYCHFTSPIRRYPDLVCHRALLAALGAGEDPPEAKGLDEAGAWSSAREREAMALERAADAVAQCFVLERELFEHGWERSWTGEVVGLIEAGAFVAFGDGHEGLLPARRLGDWWELDATETKLVGAESGRVIRLGDPVGIRVEQVDTRRGRVELGPVEL